MEFATHNWMAVMAVTAMFAVYARSLIAARGRIYNSRDNAARHR